MKKFLKISAAVLAAGTALTVAGCGGCAGCSGNARSYTPTNSNWYTGTSYKGIQPSFIISADHPEYTPEIIEYEVKHVGADGNRSYSAEYTDGRFETEFFAQSYSWADNYAYPAERTEILYCYKTSLEIKVQFTLKKTGEKTEAFTDSVTSVAYFRAAGKNLQPVYSMQKILSRSPADLKADKLEDTYQAVNVIYESFYSYDCSEVTTLTIENPSEGYDRDGQPSKKHTGLDKLKYSLFDNSSLYIAVRSMKLSTGLSQSFSLFSPAAGGASEYAASGADISLGEAELNAFTAELEKNKLFTPDPEKENDKLSTVAIRLNYIGGSLTGTTQTAWFAAITDADKNIGRATMLKLNVPLSFGLGALEYNLKSIKSKIWNE